MNKLIKKIVGAALGLTMAVGVGVAVGSSSKEATPVHAADTKVSMTTGSNTVAIKVNWNSAGAPTSNNGVRMGTSKNAGSATFSIPSGTTKFGFYAVGWNGKSTTASVSASVGTITTSTASLTSNSAATGTINANATVSITETEENAKKEFTISGVTAASTITLTTSGTNKRLIAWDAYYVTADKTLSSISVSGYTTEFTVGDAFSFGGIVTATYSDSSTANVTSSTTFSGYNMSSAGSQTVNVSYTEGGTTKTTSYSITVKAVSSIAVTTAPTKTVYDEGESFDATGMVVTATFSDSSTENVTSSCTFTPNPLTFGTTAVTVSYGGKTTTQAVTVNKVSSVTFDATKDSGTSPLSPLTKGLITFSCDNGVLNNGSEYRLYKNSVTTISSSGDNIGKIEFEGKSGYSASGFASQTGWTTSGDNGTWTGNASSVSFTASGAQVRATKIIVTFASTDPSVELNHTSIDLKTNNTSGLTVTATVQNVASPTYSWVANNANVTLDNASTATVTIKPNTAVAASSTVTLTVGGVTPSLTATVSVTISVPGPGETIETPYTVSEARSAIDAGEGVTGVYATGIVSQIVTAYDSYYGNVSFNMSADGTTSSDQLQAYRCVGTDAEFVSIGDTVIVYGDLIKYYSTYEFAQNCEIVSRTTPWGFDHLELVADAEYDNTYYKDSEFTPDGLTVNLVEVNSNTSAERRVDVTSSATWNVDLTSTGTKSLSASYGGHTSNSISIIVVEKPSYDIAFGTGSTKIDSESITANGWTVTTAGTSSFTQNASYSQVGSKSSPATSITFTKTISSVVTIKAFFIDLGGFSDTAGTVTLQVGSDIVGTGSLNATNDVTVSATSHGRGTGSSTVLTITITDIARGVKVYGIGYTAKTDAEMVTEFINDYMHMDHTTNDGSCKTEGWYNAAKLEYGKLHADQKTLFNSDSTYADAKARLVAWAQANGETFDPSNGTFVQASARIMPGIISSESGTSASIIITISLVSITAIGGYFFIKKRKEQ